MSKVTKSELAFEAFCRDHSIQCEKIDECSKKTPDYNIVPLGMPIVAEVKQFVDNEEEKAAKHQFSLEGRFGIWGDKKKRLRRKIREAVDQFKDLNVPNKPLLIVIQDTDTATGLDSSDFLEGMYGSINHYPVLGTSEVVSELKGEKTLRHDHYTCVSAMAMQTNESGLWVYHNCFAENPIPTEIFARYGCPQLRLIEEGDEFVVAWQRVDI